MAFHFETRDWWKLGAMLSMLVVALLGGLLPLRFRANAFVLSLGNALAAGVFLSAGLVRLSPIS